MSRFALPFRMILAVLVSTLTPVTADAQGARRCGRCGTVVDVDRIWLDKQHVGVGAVLGAIAGAAIGNQIGGGSGRTAATVAGAIAGGVIGHRIEENSRGQVRGFRYEVRMDSGRYRVFEQAEGFRIYRGDRVIVRGSHIEPLY